jgi:hypothetical protein
VKRARRLYFSFLGATLVVFSLRAALPAAASDVGWAAIFNFLVTCLGVACAVGTWGTAVMIASVHKVTWPLVLNAGIVIAGGIAFALVRFYAAG